MAIEILEDAVRYQAKGKLLELALLTAQTKNLSKAKDEVEQGAKIFQWCQALDYGDYLTKADRDIIVRALVEIAEINDIPVAPYLGNIDPPTIANQGARGATGERGADGAEGGGTPFSATSVTIDTVCDSFPISDSRGVDYTINIYDDDGGDMRIMRLQAGWNADGSNYADDGGTGETIVGDTSPVTMSVIVSGSTVQLFAAVTSGSWTIEGTRKYVPNNGNGIVNPTTLASGKIWVGNSSNSPTAVTPSGDVTITTTGVMSIVSGTVVNADISGTAAIAASKLAAQTASRAIVSDASGFLTTSTTTATQIGYLSNVTGDIQTALDSKISSASGAISPIVNTDLTASRLLISNPSGKVSVSGVTSTEAGFLSGVTSSLQTQLGTKVDGSGLNIAVVNIGDWNMQGGGFVTVAHGIADYTKIRSVDVLIRDDSATELRPLTIMSYLTGANNGGSINAITSTTINISAMVGGFYDSTAYNATAFNRGFITITYTD